jgi:hypothetical protein
MGMCSELSLEIEGHYVACASLCRALLPVTMEQPEGEEIC